MACTLSLSCTASSPTFYTLAMALFLHIVYYMCIVCESETDVCVCICIKTANVVCVSKSYANVILRKVCVVSANVVLVFWLRVDLVLSGSEPEVSVFCVCIRLNWGISHFYIAMVKSISQVKSRQIGWLIVLVAFLPNDLILLISHWSEPQVN